MVKDFILRFWVDLFVKLTFTKFKLRPHDFEKKKQMNNMKIEIKKASSHPSRKGDKLILIQNHNRVTSQIIIDAQKD